MGEAKRRKAEIEQLKAKGPKEKTQHKLRQHIVGKSEVYHFANAAARCQVDPECKLGVADVLKGTKDNSIPPRAVKRVTIKYATKVPTKLPREPKQPIQCVLTVGRKLSDEDFLIHAQALAQINPLGFRQPSAKEKNYRSTSLMEKITERMGISQPRVGPERSERGQKKLGAKNEAKARILLDRMIENQPRQAVKAKTNDRMRNLFFAAVYAAVDCAVNRDWLEQLVKERIQDGIDEKYLHAAAVRRLEAERLGVADLMVDGQVHAFKEAA